MKFIIIVFPLLFGVVSIAQNPLSKENGKIIIDVYMDGYQSGDTLKMKSVMHPNISIQTAYLSKDQENVVLNLSPAELLKYAAITAKKQKWRINLKDYMVNSDGNVAHVWSPYYFYANDSFSHCGATSFTLVYTDDSWKIINIIDSRRIGSCNSE
ncbi:nuclear transport factor 2 family protein [Aequorivita marina]|uniref:nuclear transport factor 2 family protein n=1 Tax=Aequorivita marina TaxID=3073654 RepID=UPI002876C997|nr:nuclear transport factor 2 family protein [Aequorivita sp. S2608]MDS1297563.1 nuclear transport factor 2 family protein [Aequorivita sp. S2608]